MEFVIYKNMSQYKVTIDKKCCIGCGSCLAVCPENFETDQDGKSQVKNEKVEELGCNQLAADTCPAACIRVEKIE